MVEREKLLKVLSSFFFFLLLPSLLFFFLLFLFLFLSSLSLSLSSFSFSLLFSFFSFFSSSPSIQKRFQKNQTDCTFTVAALIPGVKTLLMDTIRAEEVFAFSIVFLVYIFAQRFFGYDLPQLAERLKQQGRHKPEEEEAAKKEKVAVWQELKLMSAP